MIEIDEFDQGPRNIFNYGHSFGHALESYTSYDIPHGIAISYGMDMANRLSWKLGLLTEEAFLEMRSLLSRNWVKFPGEPIDLEEYTSLMSKDKKNVDTDLRLILTRGLADMFVQKVPADDLFKENLKACFSHYQQ
jgi:3-dehydroquinate synthase